MAYFVTGATGFIGRYLVANLLKRGRPIYVLVRKDSEKKLAAMRKHWGADDKTVIGVEGDLEKRAWALPPPTSGSSRGRWTTSFTSPPSTISRRPRKRSSSPTSTARRTP